MPLRSAALGVALVAFAAGTQARAEDKVRFHVDVIYASDKGTEVDPPALEAVRAAFAKKDSTLTSFKQVSTQTVEVVANKPASLTLPNGKTVEFVLDGLEKDVAKLTVTAAGVKSTIELGKKGSVYSFAGKHQDGVLILAVSPTVPGKKGKEAK